MVILPKLVYRFNVIPIKILAGFFARKKYANLKIHMEIQGTQNNQSNLEKKNEFGGSHISKFQNLLQGYSNQDSMVLV
jgi:hypothetical protein